MKDKVLEAYSRLAKDYEYHVDTESAFNAHYERPAMMKLLPDDMSGLAILDAGCAAGWYTEQFVNRGASVSAIDLSPEMAEAAKRRVGGKAHIQAHDLCEPLPFEDEAFHHIVSSLTLHYIEEWTPVFREFHRVLKPGGQLLFSVHHPFMDFTLFERPDYYVREVLVDQWDKKEAGRVEVTFYRRPLQQLINATTEQFTLERIVEPQPVAAWPESSPAPRWYERLMKQPHFLIVQARK